MVNLSNLIPRKEVLNGETTFVVNLSDLDSMNETQAKRFLELNVFTSGMKTMLKHALQRLSGNAEGRPILKLSETMGGGKTQSLLTAGILVKFPQLHTYISGEFSSNIPNDCIVVSFSGRNTDKLAWVEIGRQIDVDMPKDRPPSEDEWRKALKGKKVLILLDELSFYLVSLTTQGKLEEGRQLAQRAALALTNMFGAIRDYKEASTVVAIVSDLQKDWEQGEDELKRILDGEPLLQGTVDSVSNEMSKGAMTISPVDSAKDELYDILKLRLFEDIPTTKNQVEEIADEYCKHIEPIKAQIARTIPKIKSLIISSYPFHFATRDLVATFNMNPGFQKTRDVIRLFAEIVRSSWKSNNYILSDRYTLSLVDADFNDPGVSARFTEIKPVLQDARTTDVAASGNAHAETLADKAGGLTVEAAKWIFVASLAELQSQVRGLDQRELIEYMSRPGFDVSRIGDALDLLYDTCWYIERNTAGFYYFQRKKNLNARITDYFGKCTSTDRDSIIIEKLNEMYSPRERHCYQNLVSFPKLDEVTVKKDKVILFIVRPDSGYRQFFENALYKNRMMFLIAQGSTGLVNINQHARRVWAVRQVGLDLDKDEDATKGDIKEAGVKSTEYETQLFLSIQSVFNILLFPISEDNKAELEQVDLLDSYQQNGKGPLIKYRNEDSTKGEFVIEATLRSANKFVGFNLEADDIVRELQPLQQRYEMFLFPPTNRIRWEALQEEAAKRAEIVWTYPGIPEKMKDELLRNQIWRQSGSDIEKGPFEELTGISVEHNRDETTGEITVTDYQKENADRIEVQEDGKGWESIDEMESFASKSMKIEFRAIDSTGTHNIGPVWRIDNTIDLHVQRSAEASGNTEKITVTVIPDDVELLYTLDETDPTNFGSQFPEQGISVQAETTVRILARKGEIREERTFVTRKTGIDPDKEAKVPIRNLMLGNRQQVREFVRLLPESVRVENVAIMARDGINGVEQLSVRWPIGINANKNQMTAAIDFLEEQISGCEEKLQAKRLIFHDGSSFINWRNDTKIDIQDGDVEQ